MSPHSPATEYLAVCFPGLEPLLEQELQNIGITQYRPGRGQVYFHAELALLYRFALQTRISRRLLKPLDKVDASSAETLKQSVAALSWPQWLRPRHSIAVDFLGRSDAIRHSQFGAQCIKDGIVDAITASGRGRPDVDRDNPDFLVQARLHGEQLSLSLDLGAGPLRPAPDGTSDLLPRSIAATVLHMASWPNAAQLLLPVGDSGIIALEAASMARSQSPQLTRSHWGWKGWGEHDDALWQQQRLALADLPPPTTTQVVSCQPEQQQRQRLQQWLHRQRLQRATTLLDQDWPMATNPDDAACYLLDLRGQSHAEVEQAGAWLKLQCGEQGGHGAVLCNNVEQGLRLGIRAIQKRTVQLGEQSLLLLGLNLAPEYHVDPAQIAQRQQQKKQQQALRDDGGQDFYNRLRKNARSLHGWAKSKNIEAYRVYDHDLPEFAAAIDLYKDWAVIQESRPPKTVDAKKAARRREQMLALSAGALDIPAQQLIFKERRRQRGNDAQYQKQNPEQSTTLTIREGEARFHVNLSDYLDTGLFLDHRQTRLQLGRMANGVDFLNLFAYTCSASVHAALGGARSTTNIDLSHTYLQWGERNFQLNQLDIDGEEHRFIRADVAKWLEQCDQRFDLIFVDPPSFSNSKSTDADFDVQRDHVNLIQAAARCLKPGGTLVFSCNLRRFKLDYTALSTLQISDQQKRSKSRDFSRNQRIHHCFYMMKNSVG